MEIRPQKPRKLVVIYAFNDWDINGCLGVFDDFNNALGAVLGNLYDLVEEKENKSVTLTLGDVDGYGLYFDINVSYPDEENTNDLYRLYFMEEMENKLC